MTLLDGAVHVAAEYVEQHGLVLGEDERAAMAEALSGLPFFTPKRGHGKPDSFMQAADAAMDLDRDRLARVLRMARRQDRTSPQAQFLRSAARHARLVGWPTRRRPNGRHT